MELLAKLGVKTTLINLIMGLLNSKGDIKIDNESILNSKEEIKNSWLKNITLVPQEIFLYDSSIYENIAFNINIEDINKKAIEKSESSLLRMNSSLKDHQI